MSWEARALASAFLGKPESSFESACRALPCSGIIPEFASAISWEASKCPVEQRGWMPFGIFTNWVPDFFDISSSLPPVAKAIDGKPLDIASEKQDTVSSELPE